MSGSKAVLNFSENLSAFGAGGFPLAMASTEVSGETLKTTRNSRNGNRISLDSLTTSNQGIQFDFRLGLCVIV